MYSVKILILGVDGFPTGGARIEKLKLIAKALTLQGCKVHFISNIWSIFEKGKIPNKGLDEGISYHYSCGITYRPNSFFLRRYFKFKGQLNELLFILFNNFDISIVSAPSGKFFPIFKYWLISRIKGFKIYYPYHEESNISIANKGIIGRINLVLFNKFIWKMLDGAFPISTYLQKEIKKSNPSLASMLIPSMVDFELFKTKKNLINEQSKKYFLYCGSLEYYEVIIYIINSFEEMSNSNFELHLVCSGNSIKKAQLEKRISESPKMNQIILFGFLDYGSLLNKYVNANALLIPLRNTIQDIARFPHKIGEYTASRKPIISHSIGDIKKYFNHGENIIFSDSLSIEDYSKAMNFVVNNPKKAKEIGLESYKVGINNFSYKNYGLKIVEFICK